MKWLKNFFRIFTLSASEPSYYLHVLRAPFFQSLKFYLLALLLLSVVDVAVFRFRETPALLSDLSTQANQSLNALPENFQASFTGSTLTLKNITLPYTIPATSRLQNRLNIASLLTLTASESAISSSFATLTPTQLIVTGSTELPISEARFALSDMIGSNSGSWDKKALISQTNEMINSAPQTINWLTLLAIPFWFIGLILTTTLTLLFLTLLANSFMWLLKIQIPYLKTLQMGLHAMSVATAIDVVKFMLFPGVNFSLVIPAYLGIMILVTWEIKGRVKILGR